MGSFFSREEQAKFRSARSLRFLSPVPTRMISNGELTPMPQSELQKRFAALKADYERLGGVSSNRAYGYVA